MKKAKENWIEEQCSEIEENLRKNNSKRAYQLMKDLTTVKEGKATTVQDRSRKCLTEEQETLNQCTEYCCELYNHKAFKCISAGYLLCCRFVCYWAALRAHSDVCLILCSRYCMTESLYLFVDVYF